MFLSNSMYTHTLPQKFQIVFLSFSLFLLLIFLNWIWRSEWKLDFKWNNKQFWLKTVLFRVIIWNDFWRRKTLWRMIQNVLIKNEWLRRNFVNPIIEGKRKKLFFPTKVFLFENYFLVKRQKWHFLTGDQIKIFFESKQ